jgi:hypothetical protein
LDAWNISREQWTELLSIGQLLHQLGGYTAMDAMQTFFKKGLVSSDLTDSTLIAYNNSCAEMRSEARDADIAVAMS